MENKYLLKLVPNITEKTVRLADKLNIYTFKVDKDVNKIQLKKLVEDKFKVKVLEVKITNTRAKRKVGVSTRKVSFKGGGKKAMVELKKGDKIDVFDLNTNKAGK